MKHLLSFLTAGLLIGAVALICIGGGALRVYAKPVDFSSKLTNVGNAVYGTGKAPTSLEAQIGGFINVALSLVGVVFLLLTVYGGYIWMLARGDENEAQRAKDIITRATIGLAVVLAAYTITYFVVNRLTGSTSQGSGASACPSTCPSGQSCTPPATTCS